jgi:hypothetical protein
MHETEWLTPCQVSRYRKNPAGKSLDSKLREFRFFSPLGEKLTQAPPSHTISKNTPAKKEA